MQRQLKRPVTKERLVQLWGEAMEGINTSRDDVLDLIDEIRHLSMFCGMDIPKMPVVAPVPPPMTDEQIEKLSDPWADEWPGNP